MRVAAKIRLTQSQRTTLQQWSRGRKVAVRQAQRAKMILRAAEGKSNQVLAVQLGVKVHTVGRWRNRFAELALRGFRKASRVEDVRGGHESIRKTTQETPKNATHWSTRSLAEKLGVTQSMIHRVWKANGLKPNRVRTFKLSRDPNSATKLIDIVGLYLNPPERALVLSADEKNQIQALDPAQPDLPIVPGRCGTMTLDDKRNDTTTLFAAIDMAQGKVIASCMPCHRHQERVKFLKQIDRETSSESDIHLIVDNYATHKHPKVKAWLKRNRRFHVHFIPTSSSWLNVIERFLRDLDAKRPKRQSIKWGGPGALWIMPQQRESHP